MIFTRHAVERYRQFHLVPEASDESARIALEGNAAEAVRLPGRTIRGDEIWTIHALGIELVVKRDEPDGDPVCVTVLPPPQFRGLTPMQAERVAHDLTVASVRAQALEAEAVEAQKLVVQKPKPRAKTLMIPREDELLSRATEERREHRRLEMRSAIAHNEAKIARADADVLGSALKTMRHVLHTADEARRLRGALRVALRVALRYVSRRAGIDSEADAVISEIAEIDPGLASEAFIRPTQSTTQTFVGSRRARQAEGDE